MVGPGSRRLASMHQCGRRWLCDVHFNFRKEHRSGTRMVAGRRSWEECCMTLPHPIVFLVDVDNTLLDNDGIQQDLKDHLDRTYGVAARARYWRILGDSVVGLGYRAYIRPLPRFRLRPSREVELAAEVPLLLGLPFGEALLPNALEVLERLRSLGPTVILSDGD